MSPSGQLVFSALSITINLWSLPVLANEGKASGSIEQLTRDAGTGSDACLSPDGKTMAFSSRRSGPTDIWTQDLATRKLTAAVTSPLNKFPGKITADGNGIVYGTVENQQSVVYRAATSGGSPEKLCEGCCLWDVTADDKKILTCTTLGPSRDRGAALLDLAGGGKAELLQHPKYTLGDFKLSPDDRWLAFRAGDGLRRRRLFVIPVRAGAPPVPEKDWIAITDGSAEDYSPRWSPDGNLIYFISERDGQPCIWAQRLHPSTKAPAASAFVVQDMHTATRRIWFGTGLAVGPNRVVFRLGDTRSNIWIMKLP